MPGKQANVKNEKQYEALKDKGMSKERAAKIANSPGASSRGGKKSGSGSSRSNSSQGGTTAQKKAAGRKGGKRDGRQELRDEPGSTGARPPGGRRLLSAAARGCPRAGRGRAASAREDSHPARR